MAATVLQNVDDVFTAAAAAASAAVLPTHNKKEADADADADADGAGVKEVEEENLLHLRLPETESTKKQLEDDQIEEQEQEEEDQPADLDTFIQHEIGQHLSKPLSWRRLESCFKWRRIADYLWEEHGLAEDSAHALEVCALLRKGRLNNVEYDSSARRVLRINHQDM